MTTTILLIETGAGNLSQTQAARLLRVWLAGLLIDSWGRQTLEDTHGQEAVVAVWVIPAEQQGVVHFALT